MVEKIHAHLISLSEVNGVTESQGTASSIRFSDPRIESVVANCTS